MLRCHPGSPARPTAHAPSARLWRSHPGTSTRAGPGIRDIVCRHERTVCIAGGLCRTGSGQLRVLDREESGPAGGPSVILISGAADNWRVRRSGTRFRMGVARPRSWVRGRFIRANGARRIAGDAPGTLGCTGNGRLERRRCRYTYLDSPRSTVLAVLGRLAAIDHCRLGCGSVRVEFVRARVGNVDDNTPRRTAWSSVCTRSQRNLEARPARVPSPAVDVWCCVRTAGSGEVVVKNGNQIAEGGS